MAVRTLPIEIDLVVYADTTLRRHFRWLPDGVTPVDFTGWSALCLIGPRGGEAFYELTSSDGGVELSINGEIVVNLSAEETGAFTGSSYFWQLDLTDPDGFVQRFIRGRVSVVRDVEPIS